MGEDGAKMGPKWGQNGAKMEPKRGQNGAKMGPKRGQNGAKTEPKWGQIALNVGHKNPQRVRQWEKGFVSEETGLELVANSPNLVPTSSFFLVLRFWGEKQQIWGRSPIVHEGDGVADSRAGGDPRIPEELDPL